MNSPMRLTFCNDKAFIEIEPNCAGISGIIGLGILPFTAPTNDDSSLLGSPFLPECPDLGYSPIFRHLANAEHEAIHYKVCEMLFGYPSPNHSILIKDNSDDYTHGAWRVIEEQLVTGVQFYMNRDSTPSTISDFLRLRSHQDLFFSVVTWAENLRRDLIPHLSQCAPLSGVANRKC